MKKQSGITAREVRGFIHQTGARSGFLLHLLESAEARETVRGLLQVKPEQQGWAGYSYVPVGSPAEQIVKAFEAHTDIPLELPFHAFLFFLSGYLMNQGVRVHFAGRERTPELWTIVLAPSGCGKTFATSLIGKAAPVQADFPESASGAKMLQAMSEHEAAGKTMLWLQDEFAQKLKQIESSGSPLADAKDYLLRAYDGSRIERNTKTSGCTVVEKPCLGILGLNTDEGFFKTISPESLVDGFAQRFGYVIAERDPARPIQDFPIYDEAAISQAARGAFNTVLSLPLHPVYRFGKTAEIAYCEAFRSLYGNGGIPESFYRRVMFRTVKYALLYHFILGKNSDEIDAEDIGWASRLSQRQIADARKMIGGALSDLARMVENAERLRDRLVADGKIITPREIARGVHGVKTASEAKAILALIQDATAYRKAA